MKLKTSLTLLLTVCCLASWAQTSFSGKVTDAVSGDPIPGVNIVLKGHTAGTISGADGSFAISVKQNPPLHFVFSFVGYLSQEIEVSSSGTVLDIKLQEQPVLGQEVVVSASRLEENSMRAAVAVEKLDILKLRNTASPDYYGAIGNMKGVDVVASSVNFPVFNMRGFNSASNNRVVQLLDGMDTQIPSLNLSAANLFGPTVLDIESMEVLSGPASALYGPNAFNGVIVQTSKNPFEYQGISAYAKLGVNHLNDSDLDAEGHGKTGPGSPQPMYEAAVRYAKAFNNRFAFKISLGYSQAKDWYGTSFRDRTANARPVGFSFNPGADLIFSSGDEVATSLGLVKLQLGANPGALGPLAPFLQYLPNHTVARTGYDESTFTDYETYNAKVNASLHYRLNDDLELSYMINYGKSSSIVNAAQRTPSNDFTMQQHKVELKGGNFFVRAYLQRPDLGETYSGDLTGVLINNAWKPHTKWFQDYSVAYLTNIAQQMAAQPGFDPNSVAAQEGAHRFARGVADQGRFLPGTPEFEAAKESIISKTVPNGSGIQDNTTMYHAEGQYDFKELTDIVSLQVGASYRLFDLRSNGTLFADTAGRKITIRETGAYAQATKNIFDNKLKITGSLRYDKNENFDAQLNPRLGLVYSPTDNQHFRVAFQSGFRNPTVQGQHVDFNAVSLRLLGGLPEYAQAHNAFENAYLLSSVQRYIGAVTAAGTGAALFDPANLALLQRVETLSPVVPEEVKTIEFGYKAIVAKNLLIDLTYFYNQYNHLLAQTAIRRAGGPLPAAAPTLLNAVTTPGQENTFSIWTNVDKQISSQGVVAGVEYALPRNFMVGGNYSWNRLNEELGEGYNTDFNTPEHKFNVSLSNRRLTQNLGFNVTYRWQNAYQWQSTFARGEIPAFGVADAQVSYRMESLKSILKIGGGNILNKRYFGNYGAPTAGGVYYVSVTFNP